MKVIKGMKRKAISLSLFLLFQKNKEKNALVRAGRRSIWGMMGWRERELFFLGVYEPWRVFREAGKYCCSRSSHTFKDSPVSPLSFSSLSISLYSPLHPLLLYCGRYEIVSTSRWFSSVLFDINCFVFHFTCHLIYIKTSQCIQTSVKRNYYVFYLVVMYLKTSSVLLHCFTLPVILLVLP